MQQTHPHICLVGGGFGGLYTALRLSQLPWTSQSNPKITLIDKNDHFLFSPLLYEYVTGELQDWEIAPSFVELFSQTNVQFQQAQVTGFDLPKQEIHLGETGTLSYDFLVLSIGGKTPLNLVPGAKEYALPFRTLSDAENLSERLRALLSSNRDKIRVAVVGGGYSGVELACKVADRLGNRGRLRLIEKGENILSSSPKFNQENAYKSLEKRHIWIDRETNVEGITSETISLRYQEKLDVLPVDLVLWTVGTEVSDLITNLNLEKTTKGLLKVSKFLQVEKEKSIFALGDIVSTPEALPRTAQVAIQQADFCAWNIWATINNKPLLPFRYQALGEMLTLGIDEATVSGLGVNLEGVLGHLVRRLAYLYRLPTSKHQMTVGLHWLTKPILEQLTGVNNARTSSDYFS